MIPEPRVGLALIVRNTLDKKVLLGKRKGAHEPGTWAFPGGYLEYAEEFSQCALRELAEEAGSDIIVRNLKLFAVTNDIFESSHYVTLFMRSDYVSGEPRVMEPDKCERWRWFMWKQLPSDLMLPIKNLIKLGYNPFSK